MKLRLIISGCIISTIRNILVIVRGFTIDLPGMLIVGIAVLVAGPHWKNVKERAKPSIRENDPYRNDNFIIKSKN